MYNFNWYVYFVTVLFKNWIEIHLKMKNDFMVSYVMNGGGIEGGGVEWLSQLSSV